MAGDDEQQGILVAGHAHGAACPWVAYGGGYLSISACGAIGYLLQSPPHTLLKGGYGWGSPAGDAHLEGMP